MVVSFLGHPDSSSRGSLGRPAGLYIKSRVLKWESDAQWQRAMSAGRGKAEDAQLAAAHRRRDLIRYANIVELKNPASTLEELADRARATVPLLLKQSDRESALRVRMLSLVLSDLSAADSQLDIYERSPGIREARMRLHHRKLDLIANRYPALASLCRFEPLYGIFPHDFKKAA